jgi:hypothetical protein
MKESYEKGLANRSAPTPTLVAETPWVLHGQGVHVGQLSSSEIRIPACRSCPDGEKATSSLPLRGEAVTDAAESENLCMRGNSRRENREILAVSAGHGGMFTAPRNGQRTSQAVLLT